MKKVIYLILLCIPLLIGCESIDMDKDLVFPEDEVPFNPAIEKGFTFDVNVRAATYYAESHYPDKKIKSIDPIVYDGDTVMYLLNFKDNNGWMILSADKRIDPVLTVHETGNYSEANSHGGLAIWFNTIAEDISYLKKNITENTNPEAYRIWAIIDKAANTTPEVQAYYEKKYGIIPREHYDVIMENGKTVTRFKTQYASNYQNQYVYLVRRYLETRGEKLSEKTVSLLPTKWGQGYPWNAGQFPSVRNNNGQWVRPPAGCVAVAMGQVLYSLHNYINKPNGLYHNVSYYGYIYDDDNYDVYFDRSNYNANSPLWSQMALRYGDSSYRINIVGDFLEDIGYRIGMKYGYDGSGAKISPAHFNEWGINCDEGDYDGSTVVKQLKNNKVVFMTAYATKTKKGIWPFQTTVYKDGHAWVIDGYKEENVNLYRVFRWELATRCPQDYNSGGYYDPYYPCNDPYEAGNGNPHNPCNHPCDPYIRPGDEYDSDRNQTDWNHNHYPGQEDADTYPGINIYLTINWGWDASHDGYYSMYGGFNSIKNYQYKQQIIYNFR